MLDLPLPRLAGRHQHENAAGAIAALRAVVPGDPDRRDRGGAHARRMAGAAAARSCAARIVDLAPPGAEVWLDGGHNEDGGRVLAEAMAEFHDKAPRPLALICGAQTTKDIRALLKHFVGLAREVVAVPVEGEHKSWPPEEVASLARAEGMPGAAAAGVEEALALLSTRQLRRAAARADRRVALSRRLGAGGQRLAGGMSRAARFARAATSPREPGLTLS